MLWLYIAVGLLGAFWIVRGVLLCAWAVWTALVHLVFGVPDYRSDDREPRKYWRAE